MNNGQLDISTIIIAGVVFIIGAILFAVGSRKNKRILRVEGIGFWIGAGVILFVSSAELREILTAFAAVVAVFIAAFSIEESRRIRQDGVERESRDRKERLVNEVAEWLRELEDHIFGKPRTIKSVTEGILQRSSKISDENWFLLDHLDIALVEMNALSEGIEEAEYYQTLTSKLDEELSGLIEVVVHNLKQRRQLVFENANSPPGYGERVQKILEGKLGKEIDEASQLTGELIENEDRPLEGLGLSDQDIIVVRLGRNAAAIRKSILNAVDKAIDLKASLIQIS